MNFLYTTWDPSTGIHLGPITLHYYSLMFILAFGLGYLIMTKIFKIDNVNQKYLEPLFTWTLVGTILGARLGHVIFYQPELFKQDFWSVFLPIQTKPEFKFTGFSGLASHGATIALIFTTLYYSYKIIRKNPLGFRERVSRAFTAAWRKTSPRLEGGGRLPGAATTSVFPEGKAPAFSQERATR